MDRLRLWEQALRAHIANVELLGEVPITSEAARILALNIAQVYERAESYSLAYKILTRNYPIALAIMLVSQGIYTYVAGDYWSQVHKALEIELPPQHQRQLGQFFLEFLKQRGLPTFALDEGHRYVTPILLHAGIPNDILSDYFDWFLRRPLAHGELHGLEPADLIAEWLLRSSSSLVQKPILRFLKYGGKVAEDFVTRTIAFAELCQEQGVESARKQITLPQRISDALETWLEQHGSQAFSRRPQNQLHAPMIVIDPWDGAPFVEFPKQVLLDNELLSSCGWVIVADQREVFRTELHPIRIGAEILVEPLAAEIPPAAEYHITFQTTSHLTRTWHFVGISQKNPIAVFDAQTQMLLPRRVGIPARNVFILAEARVDILSDCGRQTETFQGLGQSWQGYKVARWDLREARTVQCGEQTFSVEPDSDALRPYLLGKSLDEDSGLEAPYAIFCGHPPDIMIPIPPQRTAEQEVTRWRIQLQYDEHDICHCLLGDLPHHVEGTHLRVTLAQVLPQNICGEFTLSLRGPLGRDITFTFGILPFCQITERPTLRFPNAQDVLPPGDFRITIPPQYALASIDALGDIEAQEGSGAYLVHVSAELTHVRLQIAIPDTPWNFIFTIALPMLQWALVDDVLQHHEVVWQNHRMTVPQKSIEQAPAPGILVRTSSGTQGHAFQIQYEYAPNQAPQCLREQRRSRIHWLFPLTQIRDTLRRQAQSVSRIHIQCDATTIPALFITLDAGITVSFLDNCLVDEMWILSVRWEEERHFRRRQLLLWSLTRPWKPPYILEIADDAEGAAEWILSNRQLPPGSYRMGIIVADPWMMIVPAIPPFDARYVRDVRLGTQAEAHAHINNVSSTLLGLFERLLSSDTEEQQAEELRLIKHTFHPRAISETLQTLLVLQERTSGGIAATQALQRLLRNYPLEVLISAIERGRASSDPNQRRRYEEVLWVLDKRLNRLLTQYHRNSTLSFADVLALMDAGRANDPDARKEIQRLLEGEGIRLTDIHPSFASEEDDERDDVSSVPDTLTWYLHQISQYHLLGAEEERVLAEQIAEGQRCQKELETSPEISPVRREILQAGVAQGQDAREHMILSNLRLVVSIAKYYQGRGIDLIDLVQEGSFGLINAVERFDVSLGNRFSTYATWWVRQAITRARDNHSRTIRLPVYIWTKIRRIEQAESDLRDKLDREPTEDEIALHLQEMLRESITNDEITAWRTQDERSKSVTSLDMPISDDGETTLAEVIPYEGDMQDMVAQHDYVQHLLNELSPREQIVIRLRFGLSPHVAEISSNTQESDIDSHSLEAIGRQLDLTRERIRQIEERALEKMRVLARKISTQDFATLPQPNGTGQPPPDSRKVIVVQGTKRQRRVHLPKVTPAPNHGTVIGHYLWEVRP